VTGRVAGNVRGYMCDAVQKALSARNELTACQVTIAEFGSVIARKFREKQIDRSDQKEVWRLFTEHVALGYWNLVPLDTTILHGAKELIWACQDGVPLYTLDAIHLAVCRAYRLFPLCTVDPVMLEAARFLGIPTLDIDRPGVK
jgi:predicted nucleic acid-binding protein